MFAMYVCDKYSLGMGLILYNKCGVESTLRRKKVHPTMCASPSEYVWMVPTWENFVECS